MRYIIRDRLETVALILGLCVLALVLALLWGRLSLKEEPAEVSRDYYIYHIIGGMEEDTAHLIEQEVNTGE